MTIIFTLILLAAIVGIFKPYIGGLKRGHFAAAAAVAFVLVGVTAPTPPNNRASDPAPADNNTNAATADTQTANQVADVVPVSRWQYSRQRDEMRDTTSRHAEIESDNSVDLNFPYGSVKGTIWVRQRPEDGLTVAFSVERGQVLCNSFTNTSISIKFDDGPIQRFRCVDASDGSTETAFLTDARRALASLKRARRTVVEAEFFQQGRQQFVFQTTGLDWE